HLGHRRVRPGAGVEPRLTFTDDDLEQRTDLLAHRPQDEHGCRADEEGDGDEHFHRGLRGVAPPWDAPPYERRARRVSFHRRRSARARSESSGRSATSRTRKPFRWTETRAGPDASPSGWASSGSPTAAPGVVACWISTSVVPGATAWRVRTTGRPPPSAISMDSVSSPSTRNRRPPSRRSASARSTADHRTASGAGATASLRTASVPATFAWAAAPPPLSPARSAATARACGGAPRGRSSSAAAPPCVTLSAVVAPAARRARLASSVALGSRAGSTWPVSDGLPVAAVGGVGFPAVAASPDDVETGTDDGTASSASALSSTSCRSAAYSGARTISWAHQPPARART